LGVKALFIPNLTFFASLPGNGQSVDAIAAHPVIRSVFLIVPEDRIAGNIKDGIDARLHYPDGTVALEVFSFFDVPMADARAAIASIVSEILAESERIRVFLVRISPGAIAPLSQSDLVQFISEVAPPPQHDNDQVRIVTNVSRVQIVEDATDGAGNMTGTQPGSSYALDGTGVLIGQWEPLHPDCSHPGFFGTLDATGTITGTNPGVTYGEANILDCRSPSYSAAVDTTIGDHATHVAGIVLGNGSQSAAAGGLALQWRGMAPNASIIAYQRPNLDTDGDGVANAAPLATHQAQYDNAIAAGIVLSTNSWGFSHCHQVGGSCYETSSAMYDTIITDPLNPDPGRGDALSILASAGNCGPNGRAGRCETVPGGGVWPNWGTVRVPNSAKNTIVVGNIFSDTKALVGGSSRGPVDDGRLKPEVVAPGDQTGGRVTSTVMTICTDDAGSNPPAAGIGCPSSGTQGSGCTSNGAPNDNIDDCAFPYDGLGGTSMSTPATTGAAALLVQQFRTRRGIDPWPSTVKALLIHTAADQCCGDGPGPDFGLGYGLINAQAALDLLRNGRNSHVLEVDGFVGWGTCSTDPDEACDFDGDGLTDDHVYPVTIPTGLNNYRVTLVYDDLPAAGGLLARNAPALVNDLDLFLVGPDGSVYRPWVLNPNNPAAAATRGIDNLNPVEVVDISNPPAGQWAIVVRPIRLMPLFQQGPLSIGSPQRYTLIYETIKPDIMIRDHDVDDGGVPSVRGGEFLWIPTRPWNSPDIILEGEDAITPGVERAVQVAVSNIGETKVNNITVNLYWANTGIGADYPVYLAHPMGSCLIASLNPGQRSNPADCRILYTWNVGDLPFTEGRKYACLLATVEAAGDEITYPGNDTLPEGAAPHLFYVWDNNSAQKNSIKITLPSDGGGGDIGFEVRNPGLAAGVIDLVQDTSKLPNGWEARISPSPPFSLPAGGKFWAKVTLVPPSAGALPGSRGEVSIYGRNRTTGEILGGFDAVGIVSPDTTGPSLAITSHSNNQHVSTSSITLTGTASDSGKGDSGIQKVTVNGMEANNGTTAGSGTANWSAPVLLNPGANVITVAAYDDSSNHNQTSASLTIYFDPVASKISHQINSSASYSFVEGVNKATLWQGGLNDGYFDLSLGDFDFQFYGVPVSTVRISTNGYLTFGTDGGNPNNTTIPNGSSPNGIIAPFWDDLDLAGLSGDRGVWWGIVGTAPNRQLVIEWAEVGSHEFGTETYSFEVILYESTDRIKFQYKDVDSGTNHDYGASATVGIENFDGTKGIQYSFNGGRPLSNGLAIEFIPADFHGLITKYYQDVLDRGPEPGGAESWTGAIERIVSLGIDVREGFQALAKVFFNSPEYEGRNKTDVQFVTDLYQTFFNRLPDAEGISNWVGVMGQGLTRNMIITGFAYSVEFGNFLVNLFGSEPTRPENNLVNDFYRGILGRLPEDDGFNAWLGGMRGAQCAGEQAVREFSYRIALGFIQSQEYMSKGRNNPQFLEDLYNGILRRLPDLPGLNSWLNALNLGILTREEVLWGFTESPEFQGRVQDVINAGCMN
jgi:hypothetical protein